VLVLVVVTACGRLAFDAHAPNGASSDGGTDGALDPDAPAASASISISSPADGAQVGAGVTLTGTCDTDLPLALSGTGLASPSSTTCAASGYSVNIVFTAGAGTKTITITQTDRAGYVTSVTRNFVRPASVIAYRSSAGGTAAGQGDQVGCNLTIPRPAGVVDGDLMIATIYTDGSGGASIGTPLGWTRLTLSSGTYVAMYKLVSSEPTGYVIAIGAGGPGGTCESAGVISAFSGVSPTTPIDVDSASTGASTTPTANGVTATSSTMLVLAFGSNGPANLMTPPSGAQYDSAASPNGSRAAVSWGNALIAWEPITAGATGSKLSTIGSAQSWAAAQVALNPGP
jgi:hypothetical protein